MKPKYKIGQILIIDSGFGIYCNGTPVKIRQVNKYVKHNTYLYDGDSCCSTTSFGNITENQLRPLTKKEKIKFL